MFANSAIVVFGVLRIKMFLWSCMYSNRVFNKKLEEKIRWVFYDT